MDAATALAPLTAGAALLVVGAGLAKIANPRPSGVMLSALLARVAPSAPRRPSRLRPVARAAGVVEAVIGTLVLVVGGGVPALLLAGLYAVFAAVALVLLRSGDGRTVSCGCFGKDDTPLTRGHVVLTVAGAGVAAASSLVGLPAWGGLFAAGPALAVAGPMLVGLLAWCAYLSVTALPVLSIAKDPVEVS